MDRERLSHPTMAEVDKTNSKTNNNYNQKTIESYGFSSNAQLNDHITNNTNFEKSIYNTSFINNESYLDEYYNYANHAFFLHIIGLIPALLLIMMKP